MNRRAGREPQPIDRVLRHLRQQQKAADGHLDDDRVDAGIAVKRGDTPDEDVVKADSVRTVRGEDHFASGDSNVAG